MKVIGLVFLGALIFVLIVVLPELAKHAHHTGH